MSNFLTIHQIVSIPWSNLNRDDSGTPKRLFQGGAIRGQLSSQSIKRAARVAYEAASQDISVRSANLAILVAERVVELNPEIAEKDALKEAKKAIGALTKNADKESKADDDAKESNRSTWLSGEELEAAAAAIAEGKGEGLKEEEFMGGGRSGALAIAAFGRMLAGAPQQNVEAALAVSPAVSTHAANIDVDYFTTVDDYQIEERGAGSTYLGLAQYINGVFYRSTTIDRAQLRKSWTGIDKPEAREQLSAMVEALIYALPKGKKNSTAPYVMPDLIFAEEQAHRIAYDFERPVALDAEAGGYMNPSIQRLKEQVEAARAFDPDNFAGVNIVSGVNPLAQEFGQPYATKNDFISAVVDWILE